MSNRIKRELVRFLVVVGSNRLAHSLMFALYSVFLLEKGLTLLEVSLINLIFHVAIPFLEIPTGAIADVLGRKRSYLVATAIDCIGLGLYAVGGNFWQFAVAEFTLAIAFAFKSGSVDAHLWDTITVHAEEEGQSETEIMDTNRLAAVAKEAAYRLGGLVGGSLGPVIAMGGISLPWAVASLGAAVSGVVACKYLPDDIPSDNEDESKKLSGYIEVMKAGIKIVIGDKELKRLTLISMVSGFAIIPIFMYWGPYLEHYSGLRGKMGLSVGWIGIEVAVFAGVLLARKYACQLGDTSAAAAGILGMSLGLVVMASANNYWIALAGLMAIEAANGFAVQGMLMAKQSAISTSGGNEVAGVRSIRATVLSVISMATELGVSAGLVVGGYISESVSIKTTLWFCALVLMVSSSVQFYWIKRR